MTKSDVYPVFFSRRSEVITGRKENVFHIDCCNSEDVSRAINFMVKKGCELLKKYKVELNNHISTDNKRQLTVNLKNPIVTKIFLQSSAASRCRKDWPRIKFTVLDKKSFDTIGIWEG